MKMHENIATEKMSAEGGELRPPKASREYGECFKFLKGSGRAREAAYNFGNL